MIRVGVIGSGYVGLVTGVSLSARGHHVTCVDTDVEKIRIISSGKVPFYEPGLEDMLVSSQRQGLFDAVSGVESVLECDVALIAVPTPSSDGDGRINTVYLEQVAGSLGKVLRASRGARRLKTLVVKSTVVPGTTRKVIWAKLCEEAGESVNGIQICMMPEFLREGCAVEDAMHPDRIVIGGWHPSVFDMGRALYNLPSDPKPFETNIETAELIKYVNNSLLSLCISFSNEIAAIAEAIPGVDAQDVINGVMMDRRWRVDSKTPSIDNYLKPGCGFGGSCFPKDVQALAAFARGAGAEPVLTRDIMVVNSQQPIRFVKRIVGKAGGLKGRRVLVLGLSFKSNTDDVRESPAFAVIAELERNGADVLCHDPIAIENFFKLYKGRAKVEMDWESLAAKADIVVLVTAWSHYTERLLALLSKRTDRVILADGRGAFRGKPMPSNVDYLVVGRAA